MANNDEVVLVRSPAPATKPKFNIGDEVEIPSEGKYLLRGAVVAVHATFDNTYGARWALVEQAAEGGDATAKELLKLGGMPAYQIGAIECLPGIQLQAPTEVGWPDMILVEAALRPHSRVVLTGTGG